MTRRSRARSVAALTAIMVGVFGGTVLSPTVAQAEGTDVTATSVTVSVLSVNPSTPAITSMPEPLTITVSIENTTNTTIRGVTLVAERGDPIGNQASLDSSLKDRAARTDGLRIPSSVKSTLTLTPHVPVVTTFRTTTSTLYTDNLCLCKEAGVYPIDLSARATVDGAADVLGGTRTYLPAFDVNPAAKLGVTWVWPLVDRPHRSVDGTVFTDDDLAISVSGGRLDRALEVVERVERAAPSMPLTLVVDPELLDELQVMARGAYTVRASNGTPVAGLGQQAASTWLGRLRTVLDSYPVKVQLTPLGDPDVTALAERGRSWSTTLNAQVTAGVKAALGGHAPEHSLAWPPTDAATTRTLSMLSAGGASTVLLDGSRVRPSSSNSIPVALARLPTSTGSVTALLTSPVLQRLAGSALTGSLEVMPQLLSELAVRVAQQPSAAQNVVLAAPRYVDPSPAAAARTILATSRSLFSAPVGVDGAVVSTAMPSSRSALRDPVSSSSGLRSEQLDNAGAIAHDIPVVRSLLDGSTAGLAVLNTLPDALQRAESAAWSPAGADPAIGGGPVVGATRTTELSTQLAGYLASVVILQPKPNSYTLSSRTSPLPITVRNGSPLPVRVKLSIRTVGNLPGFSASDDGIKTIGPNTKVTFKVPTHIERSGRIPVQAVLRTPDGAQLGTAVMLSVHSTVLGTIGVVITIAAGVVLAVALLVRLGRRVLRRRGKRVTA